MPGWDVASSRGTRDVNETWTFKTETNIHESGDWSRDWDFSRCYDVRDMYTELSTKQLQLQQHIKAEDLN